MNLTPKEYLNRYGDLDDSINSKLAQVEKLRLRAGSVSSPVGGSGAHSSSPADPVGSITQKIVDLEQEINADIDKLVDIQREIKDTIAKVDEQRLRTILEDKYINLRTFEQIAVSMDYSYRQICRLHGLALAQVKDVIECPILPVI
jgi:hypothetical protein